MNTIESLSIVVPVYQAEDCLRELVRRCAEAVGTRVPAWEMVLVEDGSRDASWEVIEALAAENEHVRGVRFTRNFGQHVGITAGLAHARGAWVVVMDCDLQDRPEDIPTLLDAAEQGFDVVLGRRVARRHSARKVLLSRLFYRVFNYLSDLDYDGEVANFSVISRRVVDNLLRFRERLRFYGGLLKWMGFPTTTVEVTHGDRYEGESTYTLQKLVALATDVIVAYSDKPLRLSIGFGFAMSVASFLIGLYFLLKAIFLGIPVQGWASLIVSLYFLSGIVITNLGVIGLYLGRVFDEAKRRPLYVVAEERGQGIAAGS